MSYITNKNTDGSRTRALNARELMQELTPADPNFGKIRVGTDSTLSGEVLLAKDSDVVGLRTDLTALENSVIDDDTMDTATAANIPSAESVKAYVDAKADAQNEASEISYDNTTSGLTATDAKSAIDEVEGRLELVENRELTNKVDATVAPTVTDDSGSGYEVGSLWVDTVADEAYRCADSTVGAAVWVNTTLTTDEISSLLVSHDASSSQHTATTVKGAIEESAVLVQTSTTDTKYVDKDTGGAHTGYEYKMYMDDGQLVMERIA